MATNQDLIGRADVNDLEAILSVSNTDVDEAIHAVRDNADAIFTWDYEKGARPALNKLYEKAKHSQWNGETDLPWDTEVDLLKNAELQRLAHRGEGVFRSMAAGTAHGPSPFPPIADYGSVKVLRAQRVVPRGPWHSDRMTVEIGPPCISANVGASERRAWSWSQPRPSR